MRAFFSRLAFLVLAYTLGFMVSTIILGPAWQDVFALAGLITVGLWVIDRIVERQFFFESG